MMHHRLRVLVLLVLLQARFLNVIKTGVDFLDILPLWAWPTFEYRMLSSRIISLGPSFQVCVALSSNAGNHITRVVRHASQSLNDVRISVDSTNMVIVDEVVLAESEVVQNSVDVCILEVVTINPWYAISLAAQLH